MQICTVCVTNNLKHARKQNVYEFSSDTIISALHIPTTSSGHNMLQGIRIYQKWTDPRAITGLHT